MKTKVGRTPSRANELFWQSQLGCFGGNGSAEHGLLDLRPLHSELVVADHPHHVLGLPQSEGTEDRRLDEIVRRFFLVLWSASVLLCAKSKESRRTHVASGEVPHEGRCGAVQHRKTFLSRRVQLRASPVVRPRVVNDGAPCRANQLGDVGMDTHAGDTETILLRLAKQQAQFNRQSGIILRRR